MKVDTRNYVAIFHGLELDDREGRGSKYLQKTLMDDVANSSHELLLSMHDLCSCVHDAEYAFQF